VALDGDGARMQVERRLGEIALRGGASGLLTTLSWMRSAGKRVAVECERRGQPVPEIRLPG
jgi:hypothetical protein